MAHFLKKKKVSILFVSLMHFAAHWTGQYVGKDPYLLLLLPVVLHGLHMHKIKAI